MEAMKSELRKTRIGYLPIDWNIDNDILSIESGYGFKKDEYTTQGVPLVRINNVKYGVISKEDIIYLPDSYLSKHKGLILKKGDVLLALNRPVTNNKLKIGKLDFEPAILYQRVGKLLVRNTNKNNLDFYFQYLQSNKFISYLENLLVGSDQPYITNKDFKTMQFPSPPLGEQKRIAEALSIWDKAIELKQQLIDLKKEQKKGLMQKLLTGKVRWEGFNINWTSLKLNEIGETFNGLSGKTKNDFSDVEGKPYITYKSIFDDYKVNIDKVRYVDIEEDENQNKVKYGDVLFTTSSETPHEVGMSAVFLENVDEVYLNSFSFGFRINDFNTLNPEFAQFLFRGRDFRKVITSIAQGSTRFNLSKKQFMKTQILVPDLQGQYKIKEILDTITLEIELLEKELNIIKEQKKGLMQQLLTGKTRVKV